MSRSSDPVDGTPRRQAKRADLDDFAAELSRAAAERNLTANRIARDMKIGSRNTVQAWLDGTSEPGPRAVAKLGRAVGIAPLRLMELLGWLPASSNEISIRLAAASSLQASLDEAQRLLDLARGQARLDPGAKVAAALLARSSSWRTELIPAVRGVLYPYRFTTWLSVKTMDSSETPDVPSLRRTVEGLVGEMMAETGAHWVDAKFEPAGAVPEGVNPELLITVPTNVGNRSIGHRPATLLEYPVLCVSFGTWGADDVAGDLARHLDWAYVKPKTLARQLTYDRGSLIDESDPELIPYVAMVSRQLLKGEYNSKFQTTWSMDIAASETLQAYSTWVDDLPPTVVFFLEPDDQFLDWSREIAPTAMRLEVAQTRDIIGDFMETHRERFGAEFAYRIPLRRPRSGSASLDLLSDVWTEAAFSAASLLHKDHKCPTPETIDVFHSRVHDL